MPGFSFQFPQFDLEPPKTAQPSARLDAQGLFGNTAIQDMLKGGAGQATGLAQADKDAQPATKRSPFETLVDEVKAKHDTGTKSLTKNLSKTQQADLESFKKNWEANKEKYEAVAKKAGVPANLVAALHWRESTGDFGTYLHQGDPLGKKPRNEPTNIPVMDRWEDAAVHALTMPDKKRVIDALGLTADTRDPAALATYAEFYNGLGYHNKKTVSPYVYAGTDAYKKGKYTSDGVYDKNHKDQQLGVMVMLDAIGGSDLPKIKDPPPPPPPLPRPNPKRKRGN